MANLSIPNVRERIFNTSKHETSTKRSSNPFAASTFKGNVLTADVFESSTKKDIPAFTGKLKASALVGTISGIGEKFQNMINSVTKFAVRIRENIVNNWNKLEGIEISLNPLKERFSNTYNSIRDVLSTSVSDLMYNTTTVKAAAKIEDMTMARTMLNDAVSSWEAVA